MSKIIGEIGSNHMDSYAVGKKLIDMCIDNDIKYVKLQLWRADELYRDTPIYDITKKLELNNVLATRLFDYAIGNNIELFFSVFYNSAVDFCESIGVKFYKIACRFDNDYILLEKVATSNKPTFVSFKNNSIPDKIKALLKDNLIPFYTIPKYPPEEQDFLLEHLHGMKGYSNHFKNLCIPKQTIDYGIEWLEVHIMKESLNKDSPDFVCSLNEKQLKELCKYNKRMIKC